MSRIPAEGRFGTRRLLPRAAALAALAALVLCYAAPAPAKYASIVVEARTGEVLHAVNADTRNYPASLTKLMTLYLTFEALDEGRLGLHQRLMVSASAAGQAPSRLGLKAGQTIVVEAAILALVTKSANDVATVIAEALAGNEGSFAQQMTAKAHELGMSRTAFRNASGLPNRRQLSTARDMALLARALIWDFPHYYRYFSTPEFRFQGRTHENHNHLLDKYAGVDGLKTGYIRASGYNLVASAVRGGHRLIGVVLGGKSAKWRDAHMARLLDQGFATLAGRKAAAAAAPAAGTDHGWAIQVGAFARSARARLAAFHAMDTAPELLAQASVAIQVTDGAGRTLFRARLVGLREGQARAACRLLIEKDIACLAIPPGGQASLALAGG